MGFSEKTKDEAFRRSRGKCECGRSTHSHGDSRCSVTVTRYSAEYHHVMPQDAGGYDGVGNCEVLCVTCNPLTRPYGRP